MPLSIRSHFLPRTLATAEPHDKGRAVGVCSSDLFKLHSVLGAAVERDNNSPDAAAAN